MDQTQLVDSADRSSSYLLDVLPGAGGNARGLDYLVTHPALMVFVGSLVIVVAVIALKFRASRRKSDRGA